MENYTNENLMENEVEEKQETNTPNMYLDYDEVKNAIEVDPDIVYLPIGLKYDKEIIRKIKIKEPDGYTEELTSSDPHRKTLSGIVDATLADCIIDFGIKLPTRPEKALETKLEIVRNLSEQDRQYVAMRIHKLEHGNLLETKLRCKCGQETDQEVDLENDFKVLVLNEEYLQATQTDRFILKDVELKHPIPMGGEKYDTIDIRIPNGMTAKSLERSDNIGEITTRMIIQMIACNYDKFNPSETAIKKWKTSVRRGLLEDVTKARQGFINEVQFTCEHCGTKTSSPVQLMDFLAN